MNNLILRKFELDDFNEYFSLVSNEKVMAFITERPTPIEEAQVNFRKLLDRNKKYEPFGSYKVYNNITKEFIGLGSLILNEEKPDEAELGYMLIPEQWGKGYGNTIADTLLQKAITTNIKRLVAIIDPQNIPSRKILINKGFTSEQICEIDGLPGEILSKNV
ncbi:GNAT family N-acetyltransferase [Paenibacillus dokdonensis]|uniref:GNAT family N-acetyltransferase n=1 Tax=Paenibacillus dokdonensis TaxID=2567944 RepID=A0ABU6GFB8_9BACL|nr:GNAT family N-acetyltransferase [Paenibacillus dokdonensis]MEC0238431.1 GNAT family N-acetyltransferase [Paenibacillus dokdonensis]